MNINSQSIDQLDCMKAHNKLELRASEMGFKLSPYGDYERGATQAAYAVCYAPKCERLELIGKRMLRHIAISYDSNAPYIIGEIFI